MMRRTQINVVFTLSICLCLNCLEKADGEEEKGGRRGGGLTLSETEGESLLEKESSRSGHLHPSPTFQQLVHAKEQ